MFLKMFIFGKIYQPLNEERHRKGSLRLYKMYFIQYANLLFNFETQYLKLVNLELYQIIEKFWRDKFCCQFVIVVLVRAGMNLILRYL